VNILHQFEEWLMAYWPVWAAYITPALVAILVIIIFVLLMVMFYIYLERRVLGRFQIRPGPNRAGPAGILQPVADAVKDKAMIGAVRFDFVPFLGQSGDKIF